MRVSFFGAADSSSLSSGGEADLGGIEFDGTSVVSELEISDGTSGVGFLWRAVLVRRRYNRSFRILLVRCAVSRSLLARYSRKRALGFTRRLPADKKKLQNNRHRTGTRSNGSMRRATRAHTECYPGTRGELPGRTRRATRAQAESDSGAGGERPGRTRRPTRAHAESDPGARGERPGRTRRATQAHAESDPGTRIQNGFLPDSRECFLHGESVGNGFGSVMPMRRKFEKLTQNNLETNTNYIVAICSSRLY